MTVAVQAVGAMQGKGDMGSMGDKKSGGMGDMDMK